VEAFTEELVSGERDWPACLASVDGDPPPAWWQDSLRETVQGQQLPSLVAEEGTISRLAGDGRHLPVLPVAKEPPIARWQPSDRAEKVDLEALGRPGESRRRARRLVPCCVCARNDWASTRTWMHFWPTSHQAPEESALPCDADYKGRRSDSDAPQETGMVCDDWPFSARDWAA
jgi:hypothetical protein